MRDCSLPYIMKNFLLFEDIPSDTSSSLREVASSQALGNVQGFVRCHCTKRFNAYDKDCCVNRSASAAFHASTNKPIPVPFHDHPIIT